MPAVMRSELAPEYRVYLGVDKHENDELLKVAFPDDWWFHVDRHSSAHIYLRYEGAHSGPDGVESTVSTAVTTPEPPDIAAAVLEACAQLVKLNSIEGSKLPRVEVVYTPVSNLTKSAQMDVGQVGFRSTREVRRVRVERGKSDLLRDWLRHRTECAVEDMRRERQDRDAELLRARRAAARRQHQAEREARERHQREKQERSYDRVFVEDAMTSNREVDENYEDEFM
ncbi:hypothetical protein CDCA_CDCA08G2517 [Cyanidium caldarium]|uniref:NFACT RNA-binding domain-containing protein n=1 Tax=Cyanidium caldarium TaxID=2771 RepID=A0AAV9IVX9_CYACA|nr:hypothetical protein CDCA_CDCA08G2517 [Cyanidium caldarium]